MRLPKMRFYQNALLLVREGVNKTKLDFSGSCPQKNGDNKKGFSGHSEYFDILSEINRLFSGRTPPPDKGHVP